MIGSNKHQIALTMPFVFLSSPVLPEAASFVSQSDGQFLFMYWSVSQAD